MESWKDSIVFPTTNILSLPVCCLLSRTEQVHYRKRVVSNMTKIIQKSNADKKNYEMCCLFTLVTNVIVSH
jgi:hypothetical protein